MFRALFAAIILVVFSIAVLLPTAAVGLETVIIYYDKLEEAKIGGDAKDFRLFVNTGMPGQTPSLELANMSLSPRTVLVKFHGLTEPEYDLYTDLKADGSRKESSVKAEIDLPPPDPNYQDFFDGVKKKEELESGIIVRFPGTTLSKQERDYYAQVKSACLEKLPQFKPPKTRDMSTCASVASTVPEWVDNKERDDVDQRTLRMVIGPKGNEISVAGGGFVVPIAGIETPPPLKDVLQLLRDEMTRKIVAPLIRNEIIQCLTPVDLSLRAEKPLAPGVNTVVLSLKNWTDKKLRCNVKVHVPSGWKVKASPDPVIVLPYWKSRDVKFQITVPERADLDAQVSASADISVQGVSMQVATDLKVDGESASSGGSDKAER